MWVGSTSGAFENGTRDVHAGFASAATGEEHVRLTQDERELIEQLLKEPTAP